MAKSSNQLPRVGMSPRADFLPPKVRELHEARWNRHKLAIATVIVSALCAVGYAVALNSYDNSQVNLVAHQNETQKILNSQKKYADILSLTNESNRLDSAMSVVAQRDVAWQPLLGLIKKSLPIGGNLISFSLSGTGAIESAIGSDPISKQPTAVSASIAIQSPTFQGLEFFLLDARQWPGYQSGSITGVQNKNSVYMGVVNVNLGLKVLSNRAQVDSEPAKGGNK